MNSQAASAGKPEEVRRFDHLKQIRRFLAEKRSGVLRIQTACGPVRLDVSEGSFLVSGDDSAVVQAVNMLIMCQVVDSAAHELRRVGASGGAKAVPPEEIVIRACYEGTFDRARVFELSRFFSMFPPVNIRLAPMYQHAEIFPGFTEYMRLHASLLLEGEVRLAEFLMRASSPEDLQNKVRLLVALYVLGLIIPKPKPKKSVFNRLISRIRGI